MSKGEGNVGGKSNLLFYKLNFFSVFQKIIGKINLDPLTRDLIVEKSHKLHILKYVP